MIYNLKNRVREFEKECILEALVRNDHHRMNTATDLGISRVTLFNKMRLHGLLSKELIEKEAKTYVRSNS